MSIKLIAFDLDGTFLDDHKNCIKENMEAIREAAEKGVYIVPSSGRMLAGIPDEIMGLPFVRYAITINGAAVQDSWENKTIYEALIPLDDADRIFDYGDTLPILYDCYVDNEGWMDSGFYRRVPEVVEDEVVRGVIRKLRKPVDHFRQFLHEKGIPLQKIQYWFKDMDLKHENLNTFSERFPGYVATSSLYNNIEINSQNANKGAGLKALCDYLGIDLSETMALGDNGNDVTMLQMAGIGVCMGNGSDEAKASADVIVGTNEEGGVAQAIRRYVLDV